MEQDTTAHNRSFSGLNLLLGGWLVISPYLLGYNSGAAKWTQVIFGLVIIMLSAVRLLAPRMEWASWLNGLCGLWLIIAPFILGFGAGVAYWNPVITGIIISVLAFWSLDTYREHHRPV